MLIFAGTYFYRSLKEIAKLEPAKISYHTVFDVPFKLT